MTKFSDFDNRCMSQAIEQAQLGVYTTRPNPNVGCVIAKDGQILASGFHLKAGQGHAEVNALANLSLAQTQGATAYVTLEPCSHSGRTGSCALALITAKVAKVVCAMQDPNPLVAGKGFSLLKEAGICVETGLMQDLAATLNEGFIKRMTTQLPWVNIKLAMSLDGRTAMHSGESQWITGAKSRADVQELRARSCAIITGIDSVEIDDSSLMVRTNQLSIDENKYDISLIEQSQPLRVVLDSNNRLLKSAKICQQSGRTIRVTAQPLSDNNDPDLVSLPGPDGRIDLAALLSYLAIHEQCNSVLVEAGARLAGSFVDQQLFDQLIVYMAPTILGAKARPLLAIEKDSMNQQQRLQLVDQRCIGDDIRLSYQNMSPQTNTQSMQGGQR